ncbi:MAG: hypothetical protein LBV13_01245 [Methanomassiliicoccaceae archaeon]|jgi:hypothetical protein|nr:hypothetical protein [Methanomassiliicoccaceae archaeon]
MYEAAYQDALKLYKQTWNAADQLAAGLDAIAKRRKLEPYRNDYIDLVERNFRMFCSVPKHRPWEPSKKAIV